MTHVLQNRLDRKCLLVTPCRHQHSLYVHQRLRKGRSRQPAVVGPKPEAVQVGPAEGVRREGRVVALPLNVERKQAYTGGSAGHTAGPICYCHVSSKYSKKAARRQLFLEEGEAGFVVAVWYGLQC